MSDSNSNSNSSTGAGAGETATGVGFHPERRRSSVMQPYQALVLGASGPTGIGVIRALLKSPKCTKITAIVRQNPPTKATEGGETTADSSGSNQRNPSIDIIMEGVKGSCSDEMLSIKLHFVEVDSLLNLQNYEGKLKGHDVVFCTLAIVSSADEEEFAIRAAEVCHKIGVRYASLCSAGNASTESMMALFRFYAHRENGFKNIGFRRLAIFRPSFLQTDKPRTSMRYWEYFFGKYVPNWLFGNMFKIHVNDLGYAMVADHETRHNDSSGSFTIVYENAQIITKCKNPSPAATNTNLDSGAAASADTTPSASPAPRRRSVTPPSF